VKLFALGLVGAAIAVWLFSSALGVSLSAIAGWIPGWMIGLAIELRGIRRPDVVRRAVAMILMTMASASLLVAGLGTAKIAALGQFTPSLVLAILFLAVLSAATFLWALRFR
jgi:hypothetical protein